MSGRKCQGAAVRDKLSVKRLQGEDVSKRLPGKNCQENMSGKICMRGGGRPGGAVKEELSGRSCQN